MLMHILMTVMHTQTTHNAHTTHAHTQSESRLQLPDTDEDLIDPKTFKVFSDIDLSNQLDLSVKLASQDYLISCEQSGQTPELVLVSPIFRNADEVDRNVRADKAVRRATIGSR